MELRWRVFRHVSWIWSGWERFYLWTHPVTPVRPGSLFTFGRKGQILELHLDGRALMELRAQPGYSTFKAVHQLREELAVLASRVGSGELGKVSGLLGTSLMAQAGPVLGFETRPLPHDLYHTLLQYLLAGLDAIYHPRGLRARATRRWPAESWMTVGALLQRYGEKSAGSTTPR
jgi:YkoP-like protein